jgi:hypothetical protein
MPNQEQEHLEGAAEQSQPQTPEAPFSTVFELLTAAKTVLELEIDSEENEVASQALHLANMKITEAGLWLGHGGFLLETQQSLNQQIDDVNNSESNSN